MEGSDPLGISLPKPGGTIGNLFLVVAVGSVLVAVHHFVPIHVRVELGFNFTRIDIYSLVTAAYVHLRDAHLWQNLQGYILSTALALGCCWRVGEHRWFRRTFTVLVLVLPVLVHLTSYGVYTTILQTDNITSFGFSGVLAGLVGFACVAFVTLYANRFSRATGVILAVVTVFVLALGVPQVYLDLLGIELRHVAVLGLGVSAVTLARSRPSRPSSVSILSGLAYGSFAVIGIFLLVLHVIVLFPEGGIQGSPDTNVVAHATGLVYGALIATGLKGSRVT